MACFGDDVPMCRRVVSMVVMIPFLYGNGMQRIRCGKDGNQIKNGNQISTKDHIAVKLSSNLLQST